MTVNRAMGLGPNRGPSAFVRCFAILAFVLAACSPIYTNHGYVPSDTELALIVVGKDTRESVGATIGRPTAAGLLNDQAWYYVESRFKNQGARAPQEIDREVVAITFDTGGVVENVERFGLDKGRVVAISRRITTTNVKGRGFLAQIFGNIGHLSANDLLK
ncbi:MAG: outer membrane protein assembly factor BamE [Paracoccaceae bacterium]